MNKKPEDNEHIFHNNSVFPKEGKSSPAVKRVREDETPSSPKKRKMEALRIDSSQVDMLFLLNIGPWD